MPDAEETPPANIEGPARGRRHRHRSHHHSSHSSHKRESSYWYWGAASLACVLLAGAMGPGIFIPSLDYTRHLHPVLTDLFRVLSPLLVTAGSIFGVCGVAQAKDRTLPTVTMALNGFLLCLYILHWLA